MSPWSRSIFSFYGAHSDLAPVLVHHLLKKAFLGPPCHLM
jgi:hypothetical protein